MKRLLALALALALMCTLAACGQTPGSAPAQTGSPILMDSAPIQAEVDSVLSYDDLESLFIANPQNDGQRIACLNDRTPAELVLQEGDGYTVLMRAKDGDTFQEGCWSPDGSRFAFLYAGEPVLDVMESDVYLFRADTGEVTNTGIRAEAFFDFPEDYRVLEWSGDGSMLLVCASPTLLYRVQSESCLLVSPERSPNTDKPLSMAAALSPDGSRVAYELLADGKIYLMLYSVESGMRQTVTAIVPENPYMSIGRCLPVWPDDETILYRGKQYALGTAGSSAPELPPADTASDAVPALEELLPAELVFSCDSTDKAEIGRAAMEYYLGLFDKRVPEYYRLASYQVNDVLLDRVGEGKFGVRLSYDFVSCGGYHIACNSEDFAPNDPTDAEGWPHGLTVRGEGRYVDIEALGGGQYKIINIYTGGYTEGMAPVNPDGTLAGNHYLMLVRGDDRQTLKLETPIPEYLRLNSYKLSTDAVGFSMPEAKIRALPEYLTLDGDCYIYQNAAGEYLFQYSGLVRHILTAEEYAALVALVETS